jgi:hypothetical protein
MFIICLIPSGGIADDVVMGRVDNLCLTDNEELARRVKVIL